MEDTIVIEIAPIWDLCDRHVLTIYFHENETEEVFRDLLHLLAKIRKAIGEANKGVS